MNRKSFGPFSQHMNGEQLSRKESSLNIHATPDLIHPQSDFHLSVPGKSQKSMHMPYKKNIYKKKLLQINKKQVKTIPNIKGNHFKHISNQQMLAGVIPEASDPISENPDFGQF